MMMYQKMIAHSSAHQHYLCKAALSSSLKITLWLLQTSSPIGRKRAKENQRKADDATKKIKLAAEAVKAQKERNVTLKRHYEIVLFTNAPSGCDNSQSVEYFNTMRARVLAELRGEESNENQDAVE